ncbi:MAG TPA: helicase HerA-like domain-containing protein [Prolixibacteraceae bacterium]|nr:helicase HerA-like domain-containing protein [Prolixibacteraceae bacterium]
MDKNNFIGKLNNSYTFKGESILLGSAILGDDYETGCQVRLPLKTFNRHGLIAGATGTGKTKTLQVIMESLSDAGVPVLAMDIKGDLSGLGAEGEKNPIVEKRIKMIGMDWAGKSYPLEFLSISDEPGVRLRATISEYGPVLLSKILGLNESQEGVVSMIFKYCDDRKLPLLDLKDLKSVLTFAQDEGKEEFKKEYGFLSTSSAGTILRNIISLEQQGASSIFGEPSFDVFDLMKKNRDGQGMINILRLTDMQSKPDLFSTFMLCLLAEIFQTMPELGDPDKPELVIFIDEAHLIFRNASKTLLDQFEMTIKLIRSKGVGIFFITQSPADIPAEILGQLGTKVQHALRAFTAKDRKDIKSASENYPLSDFYQVDELITQLGIGEAFVTGLDEKGRPTELVNTLMRPPYSRMDVLSAAEINKYIHNSDLIKEYNTEMDRESAFEMLKKRLASEKDEAEREQESDDEGRSGSERNEESTFEQVLKSPITNMVAREVTRGLLGVLGLRSSRTRTSRSKGWF